MQCIDSAVRDACDLGFLVTVAIDGCITHTKRRHESSLANAAGYARHRSTHQILCELHPSGMQPRTPSPFASPWNMATAGRAVATAAAALRQTTGGISTEQASALVSPIHMGTALVAPSPAAPLPIVAADYIRYEVIDLNGKGLSKLIPARHRGKPMELYAGAIAVGANAEIVTIPDEIHRLGCPNVKLIPVWETEAVLPWVSATAAHRGDAPVVVSRVFCEMGWLPDVCGEVTNIAGEAARATLSRQRHRIIPRCADVTLQRSPSNASLLEPTSLGVSTVAHSPTLHPALPRSTCRRLLEVLARRHGLQIVSAMELEFCLAKATDWSKPVIEIGSISTPLANALTSFHAGP
eukprot:scaffold35168_cov31-Tisochrysis_lutea.AAC.5